LPVLEKRIFWYSASKKSVSRPTDTVLVPQLIRVDLRSQALLVSQGNVRAEEWTAAILAGIGDRADEFEKVGRAIVKRAMADGNSSS
jgi:hypothetical protein